MLKQSTILIPFIHFIRAIRWASGLPGLSASPVASRLLGLSGGFSTSRLVRRLLGFSACLVASRLLGLPGGSSACLVASRLVSYTSRLLGFSACFVLLGFSASGCISGPLLPVHWIYLVKGIRGKQFENINSEWYRRTASFSLYLPNPWHPQNLLCA